MNQGNQSQNFNQSLRDPLPTISNKKLKKIASAKSRNFIAYKERSSRRLIVTVEDAIDLEHIVHMLQGVSDFHGFTHALLRSYHLVTQDIN
jgi:hypothetical protein